MGTIMAFGFNFAPYQWAICGGQIMPIQQNTALFSLMGTAFGGDGRTTYGLPNLQGCVAIGQGTAPGLSTYVIGEQGGIETQVLTYSEMALHNHFATVTPTGTPTKATLNAINAATSVTSPAGALLGGSHPSSSQYVAAAGATTVAMAPTQISASGGGGGTLPTVVLAQAGVAGPAPMSITQPVLTVNICIALYGIFPQRQ